MFTSFYYVTSLQIHLGYAGAYQWERDKPNYPYRRLGIVASGASDDKPGEDLLRICVVIAGPTCNNAETTIRINRLVTLPLICTCVSQADLEGSKIIKRGKHGRTNIIIPHPSHLSQQQSELFEALRRNTIATQQAQIFVHQYWSVY